jgi:hypothetical protein
MAPKVTNALPGNVLMIGIVFSEKLETPKPSLPEFQINAPLAIGILVRPDYLRIATV